MGFFKFDSRTWVGVPSVQGLIVASTSILKWLRSAPLFIQYPEGGGGTWLRLKKKGNCVTHLCVSAHFRRGQEEPLWHHLATENQGWVSELIEHQALGLHFLAQSSIPMHLQLVVTADIRVTSQLSPVGTLRTVLTFHYPDFPFFTFWWHLTYLFHLKPFYNLKIFVSIII